MSSYASAKIEIGGPLTREAEVDLIQAAYSDGVHVADWAGAYATQENVKASIDFNVENGLSIAFYDEEAAYGKFDETESCCQEHGLSFARNTEGEGITYWTPGMNGPRTVGTDADDDPTVSVSEIELILTTRDPSAVVDKLRQAVLERQIPVVPPLTRTD